MAEDSAVTRLYDSQPGVDGYTLIWITSSAVRMQFKISASAVSHRSVRGKEKVGYWNRVAAVSSKTQTINCGGADRCSCQAAGKDLFG